MTNNDKQQPGQPESDRPELDDPLNTALESDGAIQADAESAAAASDTFEQAADGLPGTEVHPPAPADDRDEELEPGPAAQLERLQKILAKSGIASRRHAEELITSGRVQVNGKVITELGSKADPARDHIRVDGKLLQGSERHRYFMLNKPRGYVTTVSDPEGRPTIMEFFSKTRERLYPVGRLDYLSEGLLLVTNDGELANKLTRAASGVEKTYLVKVSGQPSEEDLDRLRQGVPIHKSKPGSNRVQTAPADIRPFRPGKSGNQRGARTAENPWYEVVLIEGRNRELRKMFEEIGHHVEKIRRIGYGPLILDLEPGKIRELEPEEVANLRKAAEGKYHKPKHSREPRNREYTPRFDRSASKPRNKRRTEGTKAREFGSTDERRTFRGNQPDFRQRPEFGGPRRTQGDKFRRDSGREPRRESRPGAGRPNPRFVEDRPQHPPRKEDRESRPYSGTREDRGRFDKSRSFQQEDRPRRLGSRPPRRDFSAPPPSEGDRPRNRRFESGPQQRPGASRPFRRDRRGDKENRTRFDRPRADDRGGARREGSRPPRRDRPAERENHPGFDRPRGENRGTPPSESRSEHPDRRDRGPGQRPARPAGNFKLGKRGSAGGKQGSVRSGGDRRRNSRPGGNRPNKRRP